MTTTWHKLPIFFTGQPSLEAVMVQARPFPREEHCTSSKSALSWGSHSGTKPEAVGGSVMGPARTGRKAV